MFFQQYGKFTGGIDLPDEKQATLDKPITPVAGVDRLRVPLSHCGGAAGKPAVQIAEHVEAGARIAVAMDGVDIFAPLGGTVRSITTAVTTVGRYLVRTPAIELVDLSGAKTIPPGEVAFDWRSADGQTLRERIAEGQLTTLRSRPEPLTKWVKRAYSVDCRQLVLNAMENQPYVTADHRLLVEFGREIVRGLEILARATDIDHVMLTVDMRRTDDYRDLLTDTEDDSIQRVALRPKYPIGADNILLKVLTRKEVPCGGIPADIGAAVIDAGTCFAAYRWVAFGQRLNGRVVTISGNRPEQSGNFFVPFGVECGGLVQADEFSIIIGNPMTGLSSQGDVVVSPACNAILAIEPTPIGDAAPCIRCGWCRDHCPARLNVAALNDLYELGQIESAEKAGTLSCVECGVCSYICPARLPLAERLRQLKQTILRMRKTMPLFHESVGSQALREDA